ncbi:hypothetical protein F511_13508 [Dorcoceras hygrometricum]|uniref:Uncharacterized protein n=1 Tax=Dorcoceras hygrometricum TaxID=472368 RepID=A0A2Z7BHF9_9LAMI|nr:hypothetical protein F511_13508 [Dorcoceras hygrometricum]
MGQISNIGPKTSWAARDRPEQYLEEISHRNAAGRHAERWPPPTNRVRHSAARRPHDARPGRANSGAYRRERAPIRAHWLRTTTQRLSVAAGHVWPPCAASAHGVARANTRARRWLPPHTAAAGGRAAVDRQSGPRPEIIFLQLACTRKLMDFGTDGKYPRQADRNKSDQRMRRHLGDGATERGGERRGAAEWSMEARL